MQSAFTGNQQSTLFRDTVAPTLGISDSIAQGLEIGLGLVSGSGKLVGELAGKYGIFQAEKNILSLNPNEVRYSQESISYSKMRGREQYTLDDIIHSMSKEGWQGKHIDVVKMPEGGYSSLDNSRIFAAKQADIDLRVNVHKFNERLPPEMSKRFAHDNFPGVYAQTWGEALEYRIMKQKPSFQYQYPEGSYMDPIVRHPKPLNIN